MDSEKSARDLEIEARRRENIRIGMRKAAKKGRHIGRPRDKESVEKYLAKPYVKDVQEALAAGLSLREAARVAAVAVNTVRKVKAMTEGQAYPPHHTHTVISSGAMRPVRQADRPNERDREHKQGLFTHSDLPDDLNDAYRFCARQFNLKWGHDWNWGVRGEIAYFSSVDLYFSLR